MAVLVLPFVGEGVARGELSRPAACVPPRSARGRGRGRGGGSPVSAGRVSERTARVLQAIASTPGASNRALAEHAGKVDEGQMSKLLARLSRLGVIANDGGDRPRRGANSWRLTDAGADLLAAIAAENDRRR
jgi:hypothetical protein